MARIGKNDRVKITGGKYEGRLGKVLKVNVTRHQVKLEDHGVHFILVDFCELVKKAPVEENLSSAEETELEGEFEVGDRIRIEGGVHDGRFAILESVNNKVRNRVTIEGISGTKFIACEHCKAIVAPLARAVGRSDNRSSGVARRGGDVDSDDSVRTVQVEVDVGNTTYPEDSTFRHLFNVLATGLSTMEQSQVEELTTTFQNCIDHYRSIGDRINQYRSAKEDDGSDAEG